MTAKRMICGKLEVKEGQSSRHAYHGYKGGGKVTREIPH